MADYGQALSSLIPLPTGASSLSGMEGVLRHVAELATIFPKLQVASSKSKKNLISLLKQCENLEDLLKLHFDPLKLEAQYNSIVEALKTLADELSIKQKRRYLNYLAKVKDECQQVQEKQQQALLSSLKKVIAYAQKLLRAQDQAKLKTSCSLQATGDATRHTSASLMKLSTEQARTFYMGAMDLLIVTQRVGEAIDVTALLELSTIENLDKVVNAFNYIPHLFSALYGVLLVGDLSVCCYSTYQALKDRETIHPQLVIDEFLKVLTKDERPDRLISACTWLSICGGVIAAPTLAGPLYALGYGIILSSNIVRSHQKLTRLELEQKRIDKRLNQLEAVMEHNQKTIDKSQNDREKSELNKTMQMNLMEKKRLIQQRQKLAQEEKQLRTSIKVNITVAGAIFAGSLLALIPQTTVLGLTIIAVATIIGITQKILEHKNKERQAKYQQHAASSFPDAELLKNLSLLPLTTTPL